MCNLRKKAICMMLAATMFGIIGVAFLLPNSNLKVSASAIQQEQAKISINGPDGWQNKEVDVTISVEGVNISKMEAKIAESGNWSDITNKKSITISENCSIYVKVTDDTGNTHLNNQYVECFDRSKPTIAASANNGVLNIQAIDRESGIKSIYVNENEFKELDDGKLSIRLQKNDAGYQYFTLQAEDQAGNKSEIYKMNNPYYQNLDAITTSNSDGEPSNNLPVDATATKPTSATGTVTEHTEETTPETEDAVDNSEDSGRVQGNITSSQTPTNGDKEFFTIKTKSDKVFYLVVDKTKTDNNVYFLTEVSENDLLNFTDSDSVVLPQNSAVSESKLPDVINDIGSSQQPETEEEETVKETEETGNKDKKENNNFSTYLIMGIALVGVVGIYLVKVKKSKSSFNPEFDDDEDEEELEYESDEEESDNSEEDPTEDENDNYSDEEDDYM